MLSVGILVLTQLMFVVDTSIVHVALPDMKRELGFSRAGLSWVVTAYALSFGGLILLSGKVGSMIGVRRALILGVTVFVVTSILGGLATSPEVLVAARALQGVGAAIAAPSVLVLLMNITSPGPQRSRAMAMFVLAIGAGAAVGLLAGGVLTQTLGWEWVMFVNAPIGIVVLFGVVLNLPELERRRTSLDVGGAASSVAAMVSLVFAFTTAAERGWNSPSVLVSFTVAGLSMVTLLVCERRHPHPVMPLEFFSSMRSAGPLLAMIFIPAGQVGFLFFTTLLAQQVLNFTPIQTGLALLPFTVGLITINQLTPRLLPRFGERLIGIAGLTALVLGIAWMSLIAADAGPDTSIITVLTPSILLGAGAGATFAPVTAVVMHHAPQGHTGAAASLTQGLQQLGGAMGLAILTSAFVATGGLEHGLGATFLLTAAFPFVGLVLFGIWGRRVQEPLGQDA